MTKTILRRLRELEARFPEPAIDLSSVPGAALDALETHLERALAAGSLEANWVPAAAFALAEDRYAHVGRM